MRIQHLDGSKSIQVNMLSQIDISETAAPQQMKQAIIPKLLSRAICHACSPCQHLSSFIVDVQYTGNCMGREASCQEKVKSRDHLRVVLGRLVCGSCQLAREYPPVFPPSGRSRKCSTLVCERSKVSRTRTNGGSTGIGVLGK